MLWN